MANTKKPQEGREPIGSRQGEAKERRHEAEPNDQGRGRKGPSERARLRDDPNLNQAGNERGSADQTEGSQTGNDIDLIPEP